MMCGIVMFLFLKQCDGLALQIIIIADVNWEIRVCFQLGFGCSGGKNAVYMPVRLDR
jgi:hypothetical protein